MYLSELCPKLSHPVAVLAAGKIYRGRERGLVCGRLQPELPRLPEGLQSHHCPPFLAKDHGSICCGDLLALGVCLRTCVYLTWLGMCSFTQAGVLFACLI